eukprot:TRINITY_DN61352_c0_g2_i1.p2 TRINITY_DN61352_c0_g2~~TRINITY_DN61352_c0_g2_i1.p2  ORF type:complete len:301 (-),score=37.93 TRINITY_DN61352_c0_g2_i1:1420-2322(-)
MGCASSKDHKEPPFTAAHSAGGGAKPRQQFAYFADKYKTLQSLQEDLEREGLESCNLIIGIDYTASNVNQGKLTFGGRSLHTIDSTGRELNPYQQVIRILGQTLARFDEDNLIPVFGFGDLSTKDHSVFPFYGDRDCEGFEEVLRRYTEVTPFRTLSGPTNFAPLIYKACELLCNNGRNEYHILVIVADGRVTNERETIDAIVYASHYSLSIVMVGVGDGPWDIMEKFDDNIPARVFDNFQFVEFSKIAKQAHNLDTSFAHAALMEIPQQYQAIKTLGLLGSQITRPPLPASAPAAARLH